MPTQRRPSKVLQRAAYARTPNSFLVNDPDGFPSDYPPAMWWMGLDSGGGAYPIGPNGPWPYGSSAAALPTVTRATALITGPLTAAPFRVLDDALAGQPIGSRPRWLTDPMLVRPDTRFGVQAYPAVSRLVRSVFWAEWIRSAIWFGLGAFICTEDQTGAPQAGTLRNVHPLLLTTDRDADGALVWSLGGTTGEPAAVFDRDGYLDLGPVRYRIVVLRNPHSPIDAEGMSMGVFAMSPQAFSMARQIGTYASGQFRAGVPNGYLKTSVPGMTQPAADDLKAKWLVAHGGDRRSIAVLNSTTEFVPINLSPVDAALGETTRLNVADVAFAFALDPMTLGAGLNNSATYSNLRDAWENHRDFGLGPWIAGVQDTLSALLPGSQTVTVNLDGFANPAPAERFNAYAVALSNNILTLDEVRALEGLPPLGNDTGSEGAA